MNAILIIQKLKCQFFKSLKIKPSNYRKFLKLIIFCREFILKEFVVNDYISKTIKIFLERKLNSSGCVLVTGPKFCGKKHYVSIIQNPKFLL